MVRQIPNNPAFRLVRIIYIAILVLNAIGILLYLLAAIGYGGQLATIDHAKYSPEGKERAKDILKVLTALFSILFVLGLIKQVFSWVAVLKYNTRCIMTVIVLDVLALFINFGAFFGDYGYLKIVAVIFGVLGFISYIFDISCLSYMYIQIRQYDKS